MIIPIGNAGPLEHKLGSICGTITSGEALLAIPLMEIAVPNTLQYPLERQRDLQRRWQRLLRRTAAPKSRRAIELEPMASSRAAPEHPLS
jgi:hypothetical protein